MISGSCLASGGREMVRFTTGEVADSCYLRIRSSPRRCALRTPVGFPGTHSHHSDRRCHHTVPGQQRQIGCSALRSSQVFNPAIISPLVRGSR